MRRPRRLETSTSLAGFGDKLAGFSRADPTLFDAALAATTIEGATVIAEANRLKAEATRFQRIIDRHNANDEAQRLADIDRLKVQRDDIERRCQDLITRKLKPLVRRAEQLKTLQASVMRQPQQFGGTTNARQ